METGRTISAAEVLELVLRNTLLLLSLDLWIKCIVSGRMALFRWSELVTSFLVKSSSQYFILSATYRRNNIFKGQWSSLSQLLCFKLSQLVLEIVI